MAVSREDALRELARRELARREAKKVTEHRATDEMSGGERLLAGIGGGMVDVGRKATNLVLPDSLTPKWASDEAIKGQSEIDQDLESTGAGLAGKLIGQTAVTAPVGMGAGGVLARAMAARRGLQGAEFVKAAAKYGPGRAALEGAVESTILSNPDERLAGTGIGAGLGGAMGGAAKLIGKGAKFLTPEKTEGAKSLERSLIRQGVSKEDAWVPLAQGADEGMWKQGFQGIIANLPGGMQATRGQLSGLTQSIRQAGLRKAAPWVADAGTIKKPPLGQILQHGDDIQDGLKHMDSLWDDAFHAARHIDKIPVKGMNVPPILREFVESKGGSIPVGKTSGQTLLNLKESANMLIAQLKADKNLSSVERGAIQKFIAEIDGLIYTKIKSLSALRQNKDFSKAAEAYRRNLQDYSKWLIIKSAARKAGGRSEFTPKQLLDEATKGYPRGIYGEGGSLQKFGKLAEASAKPFPSNPGIYQLAAAAGLLGGGTLGYGDQVPGGAVGGAALGLATLMGGSRGLASRPVQKMLMGEFSPAARKYAAALRRSGRLARHASIPAYHESQDEY